MIRTGWGLNNHLFILIGLIIKIPLSWGFFLLSFFLFVTYIMVRFIAIDISAFIEPAQFKKTTGDILRALRASQKMPGCKHIYTAGEKEHDAWLKRKDRGVPLDKIMRKQLLMLKQEYGLNQYKFTF